MHHLQRLGAPGGSSEVLERIEAALPRTLDPSETRRALRAAASAFFEEARALDRELGLEIASRLEPVLTAYLDLLEAPAGGTSRERRSAR